MAPTHVRPHARAINPFSKSEHIANGLQARRIVERICKNVVDYPDTWRELAIDEIALQLDVAGRRQ
jgi:hypothetical protein